MALRPVPVDEQSPFLGEACALCKEPFAVEDWLVVCPDDATRHHLHCWRANGDHCTAYGCQGRGAVQGAISGTILTSDTYQSAGGESGSKVRTLPARGFHCAQSCLLLAIAVAIILFAIGCFGLWALADYLAVEVMGWDYRAPLTGFAPWLGSTSLALSAVYRLYIN